MNDEHYKYLTTNKIMSDFSLDLYDFKYLDNFNIIYEEGEKFLL